MAGDQDERSETKAEPTVALGQPGREPPVSEAETQLPADAHSSDEAEPVSEPQSPGEARAAAETAEREPADAELHGVAAEPASTISAPEKTPRASLWPLAAAIVLGAALAVGGAFGLRFFDGSKTAALDLDARVAAVSARVDSFERKADAAAAAERSALAGVESRIGAVESAASKTAAATNSALRDVQDTFAARLAGLVRTPGGAPDEFTDLGPLQTRIDAVEKKLGSIEAALAAPKADVRAQQDRENAASQIEQGVRVQSVAIVAESLLHRLDRGVPFPAEFATLEALGVGPAELTPLRPFAATGVTSPRKLAEQFSGVASQVAAIETAEEDANLLNRLTREASHLVRIRRVGDVDANDVDAPALVARIENALARLDVEEAFNIWTELPAAAKAKSDSWGQAAKARLDALNAARALEADAVAALGKPKS